MTWLYNYIEQGGELMKLGLYTIWFLVNLIISSYDASELIVMVSGGLLIIKLAIGIIERLSSIDFDVVHESDHIHIEYQPKR